VGSRVGTARAVANSVAEIDTIIAFVVGPFLTLVTFVLLYFAFRLPEGREDAIETTERPERPDESEPASA